MHNTIQQFITAINAHDVQQLGTLMTDDHIFIDAHNSKVEGKQKMLLGWEFYFDWFPDYKIEVEKTMNDGNAFALFGFAEGTYHGLKEEVEKAHWRLPASWRAEVRDNKIALWQVYADTKIPFEIIGRYEERDKSKNIVGGFGGVFFKSTNPKELCAWYDKHLGTRFGQNEYQLFNWRERDNKEHIGTTTFAVFKSDTDYFSPSQSPFMFNFRVDDLDAMLQKLRSEGVQVMDKTENSDYGKFGWIVDPDGNKIELWEPQNEETFDK
jgi:predicted enzyme related to lactoylglutathione lyase/ketosteroid isomerase-like protein